MTSYLEDLTKAVENKDEKVIIDILGRILSNGNDIELKNDKLLKLLITFKNAQICQNFIEVSAEWTKHENNRKLYTDVDLIQYFLSLLDEKEESIVIGTIRVLGNICYENEEGRKLIGKDGLQTILKILEADTQRKNNTLTLKVTGFLLNLLMNNDDLQKEAVQLNIIDIIEKLLQKYLNSFNENPMLFAFLLTVLNHAMDFIDDLNIPFKQSLCLTLIDILKLPTVPEISVLCLEILHGQSDKDDVKIVLAKKGVCELVFDLIEKHRSEVNDEETRSVMKMACDMIVIILTEDECMYLLYDDGKGKLYEKLVKWLDSDDMDLLSTGVLALGNFARKDTHCIQMVQNGISKKLIHLLSKYNTKDSDIKVQHALLSTLKNLVIPQQNKSIVLKQNLIDVIYPMINLDQYLVIFKLLGTFRMVIDGQEKAALDLISRQEFLEKLIYWAYNSDHLGVRGEIPRLLSWLIKNCHSFKPFKQFLQIKDSVKCLVEMISSNHSVMQNEAFNALYLLSIGCEVSNNENTTNGVDVNDDLFYQLLINADIGKNLNFVINKYGEKMDKQTIENLVNLFKQLITSKQLIEHLKTNNLIDVLNKLKDNPNAQSVNDQLINIISAIDK